MSDARLTAIDRIYAEAVRLHEAARTADQRAGAEGGGRDCRRRFGRDGRVLVFGNGGSAATRSTSPRSSSGGSSGSGARPRRSR